MRRCFWLCIVLAGLLALAACQKDGGDDDSGGGGSHIHAGDDAGDDQADDSGDDDFTGAMPLIPGPGQAGYDADLEAHARLYDREFHVFNAAGMDLNADVEVPVDAAADRELIRGFLQDTDGWDFEAYAGKSVFDVVTGWEAVAGAYAGVAMAADAYRYAVLRDQGYPEDEVAIARRHLSAALEGLHIAVAITGVQGVIARGYMRSDIPHGGSLPETVPLFDQDGRPLPTVKNNGTSRADNSGGLYPNYIWIDSCSRDQYIGWAAGFGAAWEVIKDDSTFDADVKSRLQKDAGDVGRQLMVVRPSGYDLEIIDADGRTTYHGYMNENNYDRHYIPWLPIKDGMYAAMALGCVSALAFASEDPVLEDYLYRTLIGERRLGDIAASNQVGIDLGEKSNYSGYNMAFMGFWLALRYIQDWQAAEGLRASLADNLYDRPGKLRQPAEDGQSFFDFTYAVGMAGASVNHPMYIPPDADVMGRGLQTLRDFPTPPFWEFQVINCDDAEIASGSCTAVDGTHFDVLGYVGRNEDLITVQPVPMRIRPPSNFYWRSNPYMPNGGGNGGRLIGGADFRFAYWLGRYVR